MEEMAMDERYERNVEVMTFSKYGNGAPVACM